LQDGREAVSQTLKEIEADLASTAQEAERIRERARAALPDESTVRLHLEIRQRLLERTDTLERRLERAQQALQQVETLSEELQASQAEVRLLEVEERLAELDLEAQQTLLSRE
jgi:regulator of replication initiation timing